MTVGPRASRCIGTQMCYVVVWLADAKDLHEYVHENVIWDHVNMFIMCRCQDKTWKCQGFRCKRQARYAVWKMWKIQAYKYADRLSNTDARRETCLHIYTHRHTHRETHTNPHTHRSFYIQTLLHTETCTQKTFTHRNFYIQKLLHTEPFTHKHVYTQTLLHRRVYTQKLLHIDAFTHKSFYTQTLVQQEGFTHRRFTQTLLHTEAFTHRSFYTQKLLHTDTFTHRSFYTRTLLHLDTFTHRHFYTQKLLHTSAWYADPLTGPTKLAKNYQLLTLELRFVWNGSCRTKTKVAKNHQFFTLEPRFVRNSCRRSAKIAI